MPSYRYRTMLLSWFTLVALIVPLLCASLTTTTTTTITAMTLSGRKTASTSCGNRAIGNSGRGWSDCSFHRIPFHCKYQLNIGDSYRRRNAAATTTTTTAYAATDDITASTVITPSRCFAWGHRAKPSRLYASGGTSHQGDGTRNKRVWSGSSSSSSSRIPTSTTTTIMATTTRMQSVATSAVWTHGGGGSTIVPQQPQQWLGTPSSSSSSSSRPVAMVHGIVTTVLALLLMREYWQKVPVWLQNVLLHPWRVSIVAPVRRLQRQWQQGLIWWSRTTTNATTPMTSTSPMNSTTTMGVDVEQPSLASIAEPLLDITDYEDSGISTVRKLQRIMALAQSATNSVPFNAFEMEWALLVMLPMVEQSRRKTAALWDAFYESSGTPIFADDDIHPASETTLPVTMFSASTASDCTDTTSLYEASTSIQATNDKNREQVVNIWIDQLHLSDWAYLEDTEEIRSKLQELNANSTASSSTNNNTASYTPYQWQLIRHVKTNEPGRVGHYVAIDSQRKVALIAVKGTSALSDMVTDACGVPVRYNITTVEAHDNNGNNQNDGDTSAVYGRNSSMTNGLSTISCHQGILDASLALVEDVQPLAEHLFLPAGYRILLVGHSLGAGCACLVGTLLRARLPELRRPEQPVHLLEVVAYAPPPMLNWEAAAATSSFTTSVVNNDDMIPRASLSNLVSLLRFLAIINTRLEEKGLRPSGIPGAVMLLKKLLLDGSLTSSDSDSDGDLIMTAQEIFDGLNDAQVRDGTNDTVWVFEDEDHLFVPGKVVVVYDKHVKSEKDAEVTTDAEEQSNEQGAKDQLILSEVAAVTLTNSSTIDETSKGSSTVVDEVLSFWSEWRRTHSLEDSANQNITTSSGTSASAAIWTDGAAPVLRHINVNEHMFSDHMPDAYEKTLRALLLPPP